MQVNGRYTILGEIASGGTATVFLAEDCVLRRKVALKKLHPHLHNHPEMVKRFEKEAVAVASLSHANVIKVYDFGRENQGLFLAMEYVDGISLDGLLRDLPGGVPNLAALSIFHQLLSGLAAAHASGIYHRDIKPSNVLLDRKGCVRIADFGIAFLAEETSITKTGSYLGTPGYSSPEQAMGRAVTAKTDIFATGILFYRALTGVLPFEAETPHAVLMAIMDKHPPKASLVNRRIVPGLPELIQEMLSKDPALRPDAGECARRIESVASGLDIALEPARVGRLMTAPERCREMECGEIAGQMAKAARLANGSGRHREALKLYSLAEVFSEPGSAVRLEAAGFLSDRLALLRRRKAALISAALLLGMGGGTLAIRMIGSRDSEAAPAAGPGPESPSVSRDSLAMPPAPLPEPGSALSGSIPSGVTAAIDSSAISSATSNASALTEPPGPIIRLATAAARASRPAARLSAASRADASEASAVPEVPAAPASFGSFASQAVPGTPFAGTGGINGSGADARNPSAQSLLWIKTNPPFAKIFVDGKEMGSTPLSAPITVPAGQHRLELERAGCKTTRTEFTVAEGETASLRFTLSRLEDSP